MTSAEHSELVEQQIRAFNDRRDQLEGRLVAIRTAVEARLRDDGLNYHLVKGRVKDSDSIRGKLGKLDDGGTPKYPAGMDELDDILGLRVITYIQPDVDNVVSALSGQFKVLETVDKKAQMITKGVLGYAAHHLILEVSAVNTPNGCSSCVGQRFEVQVKTVLQHAWAEFEHDIRYKASGSVPPEIDRAFTLASGLLELADFEFIKIHQAVAREEQAISQSGLTSSPAALSADTLTETLVGLLPDHPRSRQEQYQWLVDLFGAMGVNTLEEAKDLLTSADWAAIARVMTYRFPAGHVRIVDDFLLSKYREQFIENTWQVGDDTGRKSKLRYRLSRIITGENQP